MRSPRSRALAVGMALALLLAACGADDDVENADDTTTTTTEAPAPEEDNDDNGDDDNGDDDTESAAAWSTEFCNALSSWETDLEGLTSDLTQGTAPTEAAAARDLLVDFVSGAADRTEQMVGEVGAASAPDIDQGEDIAEDLVAGLQGFADAFNDLEERVSALPIDDPATFRAEGDVIFSEFDTIVAEFGTEFDELDAEYGDATAPIEEALAEEPACAGVG